MSKISRQQLSKGILDALVSVGGGGASVYYGDTEPLIAGEGSIWMETGSGGYEGGTGGTGPSQLIIKNAIVSDLEPSESENVLWFDIEEED